MNAGRPGAAASPLRHRGPPPAAGARHPEPRFGALPEGLAFALLGALHSLVFVHTAAWPAQIAAVALLAWRAARAAPRRAAWLGFAFGFAWLAAGTWWLFVSMHRYGGLPAWLAVLAVAALCGALALYLAAALAAFACWRSGTAWRDGLLFGACWLLAELARGVLFTGFPWLASGYAHVDGPLGGFAPWLGVYGVGFVAASLAGWLGASFAAAAAPHGPPWRRAVPAAGAAALLLVGHAAGRAAFTEPAGTLAVTLLQGNVPQEEKFDAVHVPASMAWTAAALQAARGSLVVGPETVVPLLPQQVDPAFWRAILDRYRQDGRAALIGAPMGDSAAGYTNSALGISADSARLADGVYRYDKHHLVPFGEFIPTGFKWFTRLMDIPLGDFDRGPVGAPSFGVQGQRVAPNICYEDLFGEELAARFRVPAAAPTIFANLSNIGWFGDTVAVDQHLQISRMRTLEFQLPMLRATNTGATAVVDHRGVVTASLRAYTQGLLDASVEGRRGTTPFAWWAARAGLWPLGLAGAGLAFGLARRRRP